MTRYEAAVFGLYTGITFGPFSDLHKLAEDVMGHPLWTHMFADKEIVAELKEKIKPEFIRLIEKIEDDGEYDFGEELE